MRPWIITCLIAAAMAAGARAQQPPAGDAWVGKRVVTKYGAVLTDPRTGEVDDEGRVRTREVTGQARGEFRVYKVEAVKDNWLWLDHEDGTAEGWVDASWVIPLDQAVDFYTAQIKANPSVASNYIRRAVIRDELGNLDAAIADYNEAVRIDPRSETAFANRGDVWKDKKDYDKAIADYDHAIQLDPKLAMAFNNRGIARYAKGEYDKAIADYSEAIRLDPKFHWALVNRGRAWRARREFDKAIADYSEAIKLDPDDATAYNNRGGAWLYKGDYDKAIADYTDAIRLEPGFAWPYFNRGNAWYYRRSYDKAVADYTEAIRLDPKDAPAYNARAWVRATCPEAKYREGQAAVEDATKAGELTGGKDAGMLGTLAAAYAERGDFARAIEAEEKALGLIKDPASLKAARERLALYKAGKPYRAAPAGGG